MTLIIKEAWEIWSDVPDKDIQGEAREKWVKVESLKKYFRLWDNADTFICGCGCKQKLNIIHGLVNRIERDILQEGAE